MDWALTERPACFEIDPRRRAVKRAYRIWVSDAAHHCVQLRNDLLFTMSDNLHRAIEGPTRYKFRFMDECSEAATPLDTKLGGARRDRTDDLLLAKQALSQLSYGPG